MSITLLALLHHDDAMLAAWEAFLADVPMTWLREQQ